MSVRGYTLAIDWSGAGTYAGTKEDVSSYLLDDPKLQVGYGRDRAAGFGPMVAGRMDFALHNLDGSFLPDNTASAISGRVAEGRRVRLQQVVSAVTYTLFEGVIDTLNVDIDTPGQPLIVSCLDSWGRPGGERLSLPVYNGIRVGQAIGIILDAIGWTGGRDLDDGATVIPWWWEEGTDAASAIEALVDSEGPPAIAYVEGGTFVFRGRHARLTRTASTTSQLTVTRTIPAGSGPGGSLPMLANPTYDRGHRSVVNSTTFTVAQRRPGDFGQVWTSDEVLALADGETVIVTASPSDPFIGAVVPEAGMDVQLTYGTVTVALSRTSGQSTTMFIKAVGGPAQVTSVALRAVPLVVASTVQVAAEDSTSITRYGRRAWDRATAWASVHDARAIAEIIVGTYATSGPAITVTIANTTTAAAVHVASRRIGDRITIYDDAFGINTDFIIERIDRTITKFGVIDTAAYGCRVVPPSYPATVFVLGTSILGVGVLAGATFDDSSTIFVLGTGVLGINALGH